MPEDVQKRARRIQDVVYVKKWMRTRHAIMLTKNLITILMLKMIRIRGDGVLTKGVYHHQSAAQAKQVKTITKMWKI